MDTPETRYAQAPDGVSIAYQVVGDGAIDVLWLQGFIGGLETLWEYEPMRAFVGRLASFARVIRLDMRATGLSSRAAELPTLETQVQDVIAVLDTVGSRWTVVLGAGYATATAALMAATHPDRTRSLILWDIRSGLLFRSTDVELILRTWGTEGAAATATSNIAPSAVGDREFLRWYAKAQRHMVPPDVAVSLVKSAIETDIWPVMGSIHAPTLILSRGWTDHTADDRAAEVIAGATSTRLGGADRLAFVGDQVEVVAAIREFVGVDPAARKSETLLRAVLFTDIVGSTERLARLGDRAWRELLIDHDHRSRAAIERRGGRLVKRMGDGVLATFEGPAQAVRAALEVAAALLELDLEIRAGVHVGEIETVGDDVTGVTVNIAARIAALAGPNEILVSSTVRHLTPGSGLGFEDADHHELKGIPDRWHLYRVVA